MNSFNKNLWLTTICCCSFLANAQRHELGIAFGAANFLGDLGGANHIGVPFLQDVEPTLFRPAGGLFYRYNTKKIVSIEANLLATELRGDDKLIAEGAAFTPYWYRHYRNLNFKTPIISISINVQLDLLRYKKVYRNHSYWTPFVGAGVGLFYMNPKALYNGAWVPLQPLGTEGQGLPGYRPKYALIQPNFPLSIGLKYQYNKHLKFELACIHHVTLTDYIDDVSTVYVDRATFYNNLSASDAALSYALSNRSVEIDSDNQYAYITAANQQRGNPKNKDSYFMILFKVSYVFGTSHYDYNCFKK